jgi:outer membrane receptor protein involved in Fe transport
MRTLIHAHRWLQWTFAAARFSPASLSIARTLAALLLCSLPLFSQTPGTGAIAGIAVDPAGKAVSSVLITAVNSETNLTRSVNAGAQGFFRFELLPPGRYILSASAAGMHTPAPQPVIVTASQVASVSLSLAVASSAATVHVQSGAEQVELESSTLGGLVDEAAIRALPLSNRNYTQILGLSPGVVVDLPDASALGSGTQNVASDGATPTANNIQFNGVDANNLVENSAAVAETDAGTAIPAPETIEEFRVQTANFDAAYGRGTGANVDFVSKSGGNSLHGSLWEFVRNNIFNANDFFSKLDGQPRPELKHNQFGGAIGGPLRHDRLFFFASYQGLTEVNGLGDEQHPILPLLTSDRSAATLGAQFCPTGHRNDHGQPATGYLTQAGGNQILCDGSNVNPVAIAILNAKLPSGQFAVPSPQVQLPTTGDDASDQVPMGQSTYAVPAHFREDQFSANLDQIVSAKNTLSGRFFYARAPTTKPFSPNAANVPGWGTNQLDRNTMFVLADTHLFRPNIVNIARFGYMRFDGSSIVQNPLTAADLGESTPTGATGSSLNAPGLTVGGFTIGDAGTPSVWQVTNSFIWQDTVAWTRSRNSMRFGAEFKRHQVDQNQPIETDGLLQIGTFDDFLLGQSATENQSPFGLSNVSNSIAGAGIFRRNERYTDAAFFAQDDIKITPRLTLNAGLRYEIFGAPIDIDGRLANFNPDLATTGAVPDTGTFSGFTLPSNYHGPLPTGVLHTAFPGLYQTPHGDIAPRLGFVWQAANHPVLVLRGGYGFYYDRHSGNLAEQTLTQPPFATLQFVAGAPNGPATLANPFVPLVPPFSSFPIFMPRTPTSTPFIEGTNPGILDGRTQEYNLNMQYELGRGYILNLGYVGTHSDHRSGQVEFDQADLASPEHPVNGETNNSIANATARMPIQGISQGSLLTDSVFIANYNALQTSVRRQFTRSFQLEASYTWSKNLDEVNGEVGTDIFELQLPTNNQHDLRHSSYGLAGTDRDQRVVVSFLWQAPRFTSIPSIARQVLNGWEFSGIALFQSGIPLSVFDGNAGSVYALLGGEVRAQRTGSSPSTHGSLYSRVLNGYLDPAAFTRAPEAPFGTSLADQDFGNSGVGIVRGPGQHNMDLAIERTFPIHDSHQFRFRTEFFNLTNTPQFGNPSTSLGYTDPTLLNPSANSTFGKITGTVANPRIIQFAAKYQF